MATSTGLSPRDGSAAPWDRTLESWNPVSVFVLAGAGAVAAVLLLYVGAGATPRSAAFVATPGFVVWGAVIAAQSAVWAVLTVPVWREVVALYRVTRPAWSIWLVPALVLVALVALVAFSPAAGFDWPLAGHRWKSTVLTGVAALGVGLPAIFAICLVQDGVRRHRRTGLTVTDVTRAIDGRAQMRRLLGAAGTIIGLAVLAAGALQRAVVPDFVSAVDYPPSAVLLYGAFFTGLLLVVYLPAHLSLRRFCLDIRDSYYPPARMPAPTDPGFADWLDGRNRLDTVTGVNLGVGQQLQASLFILAPLISAVLGALVPKL